MNTCARNDIIPGTHESSPRQNIFAGANITVVLPWRPRRGTVVVVVFFVANAGNLWSVKSRLAWSENEYFEISWIMKLRNLWLKLYGLMAITINSFLPTFEIFNYFHCKITNKIILDFEQCDKCTNFTIMTNDIYVCIYIFLSDVTFWRCKMLKFWTWMSFLAGKWIIRH